MDKLKKLMLENKAWAKGHNEMDSSYFQNMAYGQNPEILWVGCADSRVIPNEIINAKPGELFVHRNIANLIHEDDESFMSVLEYAITCLKIKYVIICGHYGCGGVKAALEGIDNKRINSWIKDIKDIKLEKKVEDLNHLVELNVCKQVQNLNKILDKNIIDTKGSTPQVIGWVYDIKEGLIKSFE